MKYTESINIRVTKKEKEFIKRRNINISDLFREALLKEMIMSKEMTEQTMIDRISKALNIEVISLSILPSITDDSTIVQFRMKLR